MTADRNEKIKARKKVTEMKKKNYTLLFDEKSFQIIYISKILNKYVVIVPSLY